MSLGFRSHHLSVQERLFFGPKIENGFAASITVRLHSYKQPGAAAGENQLIPVGGSKCCMQCVGTAAVDSSGCQICILYKSMAGTTAVRM